MTFCYNWPSYFMIIIIFPMISVTHNSPFTQFITHKIGHANIIIGNNV